MSLSFDHHGGYMGLKLTNNGLSYLGSSLSDTGTTATLTTGHGGLFPALSAGDWFPLTLVNSSGQFEIAHVTARSGDVLTLTRAQEGTTALSFPAGSRVELRLTAAAVATIQAEIAGVNSALLALLPPGAGPIPWTRIAEPAGWIFADGRVLLASTPYTALRAAYIADNYPFGSDGAGNPRIPDMSGRVPAGRDASGSSRLTASWSMNGVVLGATGGLEYHTLTTAQMPSHTHPLSEANHTHTVSDPGHTHTISGARSLMRSSTGSGIYLLQTNAGTLVDYSVTLASKTTGITLGGAKTNISMSAQGSGAAHPNVQPTIIMNYILKV